MLHIILLILKIIGIVLLCILGILLLAICCALFVPLRYRIEVFREESGDQPPAVVRAKITWMLHLVNILVCYPSDVYLRVRIFLFTLFRLPEKENKKPARKKKAAEEGNGSGASPDDGMQDGQTVQTAQIPRTVPAAEDGCGSHNEQAVPSERGEAAERMPRTGQILQADQIPQTDQEGSASSDGEREQSDSVQEPSGFIRKIIKKIHALLDRIKQLTGKVKEAAENIQYTIRRFCDKIKSMLDNIQYYREVLESDSFRNSWALCRNQAGIILKELKPDKYEADVIIGTEDPSTTGEILAVYGMLYPLIGQHVRIVGDFERARVEGRIFIKGKIRVFTFLRVAVKVYLNKDMKKLIKLFKKEAV